MPFKSRSQEDLFVAANASSTSVTETKETSRDDHSVAMTMTSLLLLRPDASSAAATDTVILSSPATSFSTFKRRLKTQAFLSSCSR